MIGRLARIAGAFFRSALQEEFAYRGDLLGNVIRSVLNLGTAIGSVAVIFAHTETLGGWTLGQTLSLLGIFVFINGFVAMFMSPSLNRVVEEVREGTFDYVLMKPVPVLFLASARRFVVWHVSDIVLGAIVLGVALLGIDTDVSGWGVLLFVALLTCGVAIVYAIWLALTTLVFWFVRVANVTMIFNLFFQTGRYPIEVYPFWLRQLLTFVFPVAFVTTVPAQVVTGRDPSWLVWVAPVIAVIAVLAATRFWRFGLSRYTSASS